MRKLPLLFSVAALLSISSTSRADFYVSADAPAGGNGSINSPFSSIHQAFAAVGSNQTHVIHVKEGLYEEHVGSESTSTSLETRSYTFRGGYVLSENFNPATRDPVAHPTIVDGTDTSRACVAAYNAKYFEVDGFELRGCRVGVWSRGYSAARNVVVRFNYIHDNGFLVAPNTTNTYWGAGITVSGTGLVSILDNDIINNHAGRYGGGIYVGSAPSSESNIKNTQTQTISVGSSFATVRNNIVQDNTISGSGSASNTPHGAGMCISINADISNNFVDSNEAFDYGVGGGIFVQNQWVVATVNANLVSNNLAPKAGSGIFIDEAAIALVVNNLVVGNAANGGRASVLLDGRANGVGVDNRTFSAMLNNTVVNNTGQYSEQGFAAQDSTGYLRNNLFSSTGTEVYLMAGGVANVDYTRALTTCSGCTWGSHNTTNPPGFVSSTDFHLDEDSLMIDTGETQASSVLVLSWFGFSLVNRSDGQPYTWTIPANDYDGIARPQEASADIGAFEFEDTSSSSSTTDGAGGSGGTGGEGGTGGAGGEAGSTSDGSTGGTSSVGGGGAGGSAGSGGTAGSAGSGGTTTVCETVQRGTFGTVVDATIWQSTPTWNDGTSTALQTGTSSAGPRNTVLKFDLSFIPSGATVESATATLNQSWKTGTSTVRAHVITTSWAETTVNWNVIGSNYESSPFASFSAADGSGDRTFDMTDECQDWVDGYPNNGLLLEEDFTLKTSFRSSEYSTSSQRPKLAICYTY